MNPRFNEQAYILLPLEELISGYITIFFLFFLSCGAEHVTFEVLKLQLNAR
jgi:hypothetical protein